MRKLDGVPLYWVGFESLTQKGRVCGSLQVSPRGLFLSPSDLASFNLSFFRHVFFPARNSIVKKRCKPADLAKRRISSCAKENMARPTKVRSVGAVALCSNGLDSPSVLDALAAVSRQSSSTAPVSRRGTLTLLAVLSTCEWLWMCVLMVDFYSIEDVICVFSSAVIAGRSISRVQVGGSSLRLGFAR